MRTLIGTVLIAALTAGLPAAAQTRAEEQAFETALTARDMVNAAAHLDALITARLPASGKPVSDPYLNLQIGRFLLMTGHPRAALPWLEGAENAATTGTDRIRLSLDRARALLMLGHATAALPLIDAVLPTDDPATLGLATRMRIDALLLTDPTSAAAALSRADAIRTDDSGAEWDWSLLDARAALLTGAPTAAAKVRHAWAEAVGAPLPASAPARSAAMMAMIEERAGNRPGALAMMAAAARSEPDVSAISTKLAAALPLCGGSITREDHVTVTLHRDSLSGATRMSAIDASRPAMVSLFLAGINAADILDSGTLTTAATIARLRCRTSPGSDAASRTVDRDPAALFMARHGIYPRFGYRGTGEEQLNAASSEVDNLTARFGENSPILLGPLLRLIQLTQARLMEAGDVPPTRLVDLAARLGRVLTAAGDTSAFLPADNHFFAAFARAVGAPSREAAAQVMADAFGNFVRTVDFPIAYSNLAGASEGIDASRLDSIRADLVERGLKILPSGDSRIAALRLARVEAARTSSNGTLADRVRETGLPRDLCALQGAIPRMRSNDITDDDYPADGLIAELTGRTTLELDVDANGRAHAPRTIVSLPPILFDAVVAKRSDGFTYFPAEAAGSPVACRALVLAIRWKMPEREEGGPLSIVPESWMPGS